MPVLATGRPVQARRVPGEPSSPRQQGGRAWGGPRRRAPRGRRHGAGPRRLPYDGRGRLGRPRSRTSGSSPRSPTTRRGRAPLCWSDRALWPARRRESSSAPAPTFLALPAAVHCDDQAYHPRTPRPKPLRPRPRRVLPLSCVARLRRSPSPAVPCRWRAVGWPSPGRRASPGTAMRLARRCHPRSAMPPTHEDRYEGAPTPVASVCAGSRCTCAEVLPVAPRCLIGRHLGHRRALGSFGGRLRRSGRLRGRRGVRFRLGRGVGFRLRCRLCRRL